VTESPGLPEQGLAPADVLERLAALRAGDVPHEGGRLFAYVFEHGDPTLHELQLAAFTAFSAVNMLDPTAFPSVAAMENDVVGALLDLFRAPEGAVGTFTSGGTESCLLAVKSARDGRLPAGGPAAGRPELVLPESGHPAFAKAAEWLGLDVVQVPVDPETLTPRVADVAAAIGPRTALVVASAVSYPHGVLDPVAEIAAACRERGAPLHVDACIGGLVLAGRRELGDDVPPFDLAVPGVASLSVDLHKYGYTLKPASALLFADRERRRASWFGYGRWAGYPIVNSTVQSTKPAGPLAAAWATFRHLGREGYLRAFERQLAATRTLLGAVAETDGVRVLGRPAASLFAIAAATDAAGRPGFDIGLVHDALVARGWHVQMQLGYGVAPPSLHLTVDAAAADTADALAADLRDAVAQVREAPPPELPADLVGVLPDLEPSMLTPENFADLLAAAGLDGGTFTVDARVNALLQLLDPDVRRVVVTLAADQVFTPARARTPPAAGNL
jgi:glutamate/tyrosine decarboxylase-like PLP-dependent enzyme